MRRIAACVEGSIHLRILIVESDGAVRFHIDIPNDVGRRIVKHGIRLIDETGTRVEHGERTGLVCDDVATLIRQKGQRWNMDVDALLKGFDGSGRWGQAYVSPRNEYKQRTVEDVCHSHNEASEEKRACISHENLGRIKVEG